MSGGLFESQTSRETPSIQGLVETLRRIHEARTRAVSTNAANGGPAASEGVLDGVERKTRKIAALFKSASANADDQDGLSGRYRELRVELAQAELDARRRADTAERSVGRGSPAERFPAAPYQETLYLRCQRAGRSGGRFQCRNARNRRTEVRAVRRSIAVAGTTLPVAPTLIVRPESFALEAGASIVLSVAIDLTQRPDVPAGLLETCIDLMMDDALALKLWIEVDVYDFA